ncbi:predicted protein [Naegleria gruberi]|uniref:Predicted protein n=1 Tax=Naegleria gruberi TaxID=5762 RepID=D2VT28_NAEGR|nr:uncharacterized protein NAEGRDRAFT_72152 [Naegleria gruberi]EFC40011.1 predicted protein [Naegleria gruberi]|eukprot:XP_002672755.1 predicted protein [Naegleria gruberi strain NEG-M]
MHDCCKQGHIHTGTPTGTLTQISGRETYVKKHSNSNGKAILFIHDAFGLPFINNQLLVDTFSEEAQADVYLPDFFNGDGVPIQVLSNMSSFDFNPWRARNGRDKFPIIESYTRALKEQEGIKKLVVIGFCWGGWGSIQLGQLDDLVDGVVLAHPSMLEIPSDIEALKKPSLFICAEVDHAFSEEARLLSQSILENKEMDATFKLWNGVRHGFAVRFDTEDKIAAQAAEQAKDEAVKFFKRILQ